MGLGRGDSLAVPLWCQTLRETTLSVDDFIDRVQHCQVTVAEISRQEKQQLQLQWRAVFAFTLNVQRARRTSSSRDWHIFSTKQAVCREHAMAQTLYQRIKSADFFIIPEAEELPGLRCTAAALPDLSALALDLYVFPPDLAWTMVFTHEPAWHGPYFAQREWQKIKL